jgi:hypothetical protein
LTASTETRQTGQISRKTEKIGTPLEDRRSNFLKMAELHPCSPSDGDVVEYLTNEFPDIYLASIPFDPDKIFWGVTMTGRKAFGKRQGCTGI